MEKCYLELSKSESTAGTDTAVVLDSRAVHNGAQLVNRTGSNSSGLGAAGLTTTQLAAGLYSKVDQSIELKPDPFHHIFFSLFLPHCET